MRLLSDDIYDMKRIEYGALYRYLKRNQWVQCAEIPGLFMTFRKKDLEIMVPSKKELGDYAQRIYEAICTLSIDENRSQIAIFEELS